MDSVTDIIETTNETIDTRKSITKLVNEVKRYQQKTRALIDANYSDFLVNLSSNEIYLAEGEKLIKEIENVLQIIESDTKNDLYSATEEMKSYIDELEEMQIGTRLSLKILKIDKLFELLEESKNNNEYLQEMNYLDEIKLLINDKNDTLLSKLNCYQNIKIKYHIESELLLHNLKQCFEQLIQFHEKLFQNTKSINIKITTKRDQLKNIIKALFSAKYNPKKLCDFLLMNVFQPIVEKPVSIELIGLDDHQSNKDDDCEKAKNKQGKTDQQKSTGPSSSSTTTIANINTKNVGIDPEFIQLFLSFSSKELDDDLRPTYKIVFNNMKLIFKCLNYMNIELSKNMNVFKLLFNENMKEKLLNLIINDCIMYSIPDTIDEMNQSTLVNDILEFDKYLKFNNILNEDDLDLKLYAEKMEILFRNRFCSKIVDNAIEIMKKDLHDMTLITNNEKQRNLTSSTETASSSSLTSGAIDDSMAFPRCMISKSTLELINLMENVLKQTSIAGEEISERLLSTIPTIISHYLTEIPNYHEKLLLNIPQQTALFHNNCQYLAYWLHRNHDKKIESIDKIIFGLQHLGAEYLDNQIRNQRNQIMEILQGFDLYDGISELGVGPQKIVRQCLRQLDLLKNVWQTILSNSTYNKTMCNLLNDFCSEIIKRILNVEDLPTSVADGLSEICSIILERAPTVFENEHQVYEVKSWVKLKQLKMILSASLIEITEQWSEGKGPLTMNYKAEEIKHLIRALFQNTDRRANALASIV